MSARVERRSCHWTIACLLLGGCLLAPQPATARAATTSPGVIATFAGGPGAGSAIRLGQGPARLTVGPDGAVYSSDDYFNVIRKLDPSTGFEQAVIGTGVFGSAGDGGRASAASLNTPQGLALDGQGDLAFVDMWNFEVRLMPARSATYFGQAMAAGNIYTVAGNGYLGTGGDGGPATSNTLYFPEDVAFDSDGNLVIADTANNRVRVVAAGTATFYGQSMTVGDIYTVASLNYPSGVAVDAQHNLVISDAGDNRVYVLAASTATFYGQSMTAGGIYTVAGGGPSGSCGDGGPATSADLCGPEGVAVDIHGNLVIADSGAERIQVVAANSGSFYGQAMTAGYIYTVAGIGLLGFGGDGASARQALLKQPTAVALDSDGNVVFTDAGNNRIRSVAAASASYYGLAMTAGDIYTVAGNGTAGFSGDDHAATDSELSQPTGIAFDSHQNLVVADYYNNRVRVVAGSTGTYYGKAMAGGNIYTIAGDRSRRFGGDGGKATAAALNGPWGVAVDGAGNVLITDSNHNRLRLVAAASGTFYGQQMTAGDIYTVAGDGTLGYGGDGGIATAAQLGAPCGVTVDGHGNPIVVDSYQGSTSAQNRIRVVAASDGTFYGQVMAAGHIYTVAGGGTQSGGLATAASLSSPCGVAVDGRGNLVLTDAARIRVVAATAGTFYGQSMKARHLYTIAGNGNYGFSGDGGSAVLAALEAPQSVALDGDGNVLVADSGNQRVRVIAPTSGSFYGQSMTAGDIYTVAGGGEGLLGDGGPATAAQLTRAQTVCVNGSGQLFIGDLHRIREVAV